MARAEDVDLLLTNGNVYTVTESQPRAEAMAENGQPCRFCRLK